MLPHCTLSLFCFFPYSILCFAQVPVVLCGGARRSRGAQSQSALGERRTAAKRASGALPLAPGSARRNAPGTPRSPPRPDTASAAAAADDDVAAALWGGGGTEASLTRDPSARSVGPAGVGLMSSSFYASSVAETEFSLRGEAAIKAMAYEKEVRRKHALLGHYRDALSDLKLTAQFQESDYAQGMAQLQRFIAQAASVGGAGGRLGAVKRAGGQEANEELEKKLTSRNHRRRHAIPFTHDHKPPPSALRTQI